jgi:hypothetical protein
MTDVPSSPAGRGTPRRGDAPSVARGVAVAALVLCAGLAVAWVDTRPGWDDTGITVSLLALVAGGGTLVGVRPWLAAILSAAPVVLAEVRSGWGVLLAVPVALVGAYAARLARRGRP